MKPKIICIGKSYIFTALFIDKFSSIQRSFFKLLYPLACGKDHILSEAVLCFISVEVIYS